MAEAKRLRLAELVADRLARLVARGLVVLDDERRRGTVVQVRLVAEQGVMIVETVSPARA